MKRLTCKALGCEVGEYPACIHCHEDLYSIDFVQEGWLGPIIRIPWVILGWLHKLCYRCPVCHKHVWFSRSDFCWPCSDECSGEWVPF